MRVGWVHIVAGNDDEGLSAEELILIGLFSILNGDYMSCIQFMNPLF
ncbi:MAG: hypothetical protein ACQET6_14560 [Bacillota bacterium]